MPLSNYASCRRSACLLTHALRIAFAACVPSTSFGALPRLPLLPGVLPGATANVRLSSALLCSPCSALQVRAARDSTCGAGRARCCPRSLLLLFLLLGVCRSGLVSREMLKIPFTMKASFVAIGFVEVNVWCASPPLLPPALTPPPLL